MANENGNGVRKISAWIKVLASIVGLLITIGGVIWGVETRYAKAGAVKEQISAVQTETIKAFQQVHTQFEQLIKQQKIDSCYNELGKLNEWHIAIEKRLAVQPNNTILKEERRDIIKKKELMQQKLDKLME